MGILVSLYKIYRAFSLVYDAIIAFRMLYVVLSSLRNIVADLMKQLFRQIPEDIKEIVEK